MVSRPNIRGMNHSIIWFMDFCWGPPLTGIIFCCSHMEPPTRMGRATWVGSRSARFSHRNWGSRGIMLWSNAWE